VGETETSGGNHGAGGRDRNQTSANQTVVSASYSLLYCHLHCAPAASADRVLFPLCGAIKQQASKLPLPKGAERRPLRIETAATFWVRSRGSSTGVHHLSSVSCHVE
jgi:hypothetical protein